MVHAGSFDLDAGRRDARLQRSSGQQHHGRPSRFSLSTLTAIPRPPTAVATLDVRLPFLSNPPRPPPHRGMRERVREKERERAAALPPVSLVVLYLSSLTSTRACHLCESTEILINSYCDKGSSLFSRTVLLLDI